MDGRLEVGRVLESINKIQYKIVKKLGEGGQGEVYHVKSGKKDFALKWYFPNSATPKQMTILESLIKKPEPDDNFLWPKDIIIEGPLFGYIMFLRPAEYKNIVDLMFNRITPSFRSLSITSINFAKSMKNLHSMGLSYCDISYGNMFFNPTNGDVLICDNDNVITNKQEPPVLGTPRFMAPEIARGEAKPSTETDLYSMATLFFLVMMVHHPLEGAIEASIKAMDRLAMTQIYGNKPVFIYDPNNKTNRPIRGYQDNAIKYWEIYPKFFQDKFTKSFTDGLHKPNKRLVEKEWIDAFSKLIDSIIICPSCGVELFYDESRVKNSVSHICWGCQKSIPVPNALTIGKKMIVLNKDTKLSSHQINNDYNFSKIVAEVTQNPKNLNEWGLKNLSSKAWSLSLVDGKQSQVDKEKSVSISIGVKINFGSEIGEFKNTLGGKK